MNNTALVDFYHTGHHTSYLDAVLLGGCKYDVLIGPHELVNRYSTKINTCAIEHKFLTKSSLMKEFLRIKAVVLSSKAARRLNNSSILYLYGDRFILGIYVSKILLPLVKQHIIIHWLYFLSEEKSPFLRLKYSLDVWALRRLSAMGAQIFVHTKSGGDALKKTGIKAEVIPYPLQLRTTGFSKEKVSENQCDTFLPISSSRIFNALLFGGTRFDKGADLAIRALSLLPGNFRLRIVGKEEDFSRKALLRLAAELKCEDRLDLDLRFIPDLEIQEVFSAADVLLLPYRTVFSGQSGPLTLAISYDLPVVAAHLDALAETIYEYDAGRTFTPENVKEMASAVELECSTNRTIQSKRFIIDHDPRSFSTMICKRMSG